MTIVEGTKELKSWRGVYDFAVDGGAVSSITLRSDDGEVPLDAVIEGGYIDAQTVFASGGAATGALNAEAAGDLLAAAAYNGAPWSTQGRKSVLPAFTGATTLRTTAARKPAITIAGAALTAGKFELVLFYR